MFRFPAFVLAVTLLAGCALAATEHFTGAALPPTQAPDFTLTSDAGTPWTLSQQHGKVVALFFGFTHCTDTCPDTLAKLAKVMQQTGANAKDAEIAFVTIDPARDTPAVMHTYKRRFSGADIVGLTGSQAQIDAVMREYHVWTKKVPGKGDDYDEDHTAFTFLIGRNGDERVVHNDDDPQRDYASDVRTLLQ